MGAGVRQFIKRVLGRRYLAVREVWVRTRFPAIKRKLADELSGEITIEDRAFTYRPLTEEEQPVLTEFLSEALQAQDIALLRLSSNGVDFHNPAHLYLGLFDANRLIALNWIRIDDLRLLEKGSAVAFAWRRKGIYRLLHERFCNCCDQLGFAHYIRTADENTIILNFLEGQGYTSFRQVDGMSYLRKEPRS